jgi:hypothetical protein
LYFDSRLTFNFCIRLWYAFLETDSASHESSSLIAFPEHSHIIGSATLKKAHEFEIDGAEFLTLDRKGRRFALSGATLRDSAAGLLGSLPHETRAAILGREDRWRDVSSKSRRSVRAICGRLRKREFTDKRNRNKKLFHTLQLYPDVSWIGKNVSKSATTRLSNRKTLRNFRFYFARIAKTRPSKRIIFGILI